MWTTKDSFLHSNLALQNIREFLFFQYGTFVDNLRQRHAHIRECDERSEFSHECETLRKTFPNVGKHKEFAPHIPYDSSTPLAQRIRMNPYHVLEQLIDLERRVRQVYRILSERPQCSPARRAFWQAMTEDETHDIVTLERSAYVCDVLERPPAIPDEVRARVEAAVAAAEAMVQNPSLTEDEALRQALNLEASELNRMEDAWLHGFRVTTSLLLRALAPKMSSHIQRLVDAVHNSSTDPTLHAHANALRATYQRQQETTSHSRTSD